MQQMGLLALLAAMLSPLLPWHRIVYTRPARRRGLPAVSGMGGLARSEGPEWATAPGPAHATLQEDGYVILRRIVPTALAARLLHEARSLVRRRRESGRLPLVRVTALYGAWLESPLLREFWASSGIGATVGRTVNATRLRLLEDALLVTERHRMAYGCWHSDWYSFGSVARETQRRAAHSVWIPLVDVSAQARGGSVQFCRRRDVPPNCSHVDFDAEEKEAESTAGRRGGGGGADWCERAMDAACVAPDFQAGDAVVFAADMVHRTQALRDVSFERVALIGRFVSSEAKYHARKTSFLNSHTYKVQHDMCRHGLRENASFEGPCFPQLFPIAESAAWNTEQQYVEPWAARGMAFLEKVWFGAILPD
jgi:hypothetical protein